MLTLSGSTDKQVALLEPDSLLVVQNGSWNLYWSLANEDLKVEYIEEKIYIHSPASLRHEQIFRILLVSISKYNDEKNAGMVVGSRFPVVLPDGKRTEPDILFLTHKAIMEGNLTETFFEGHPTWIIEIVSPAYRDHDTVRKRATYRELGVGEYWIVDPEYKTVEVLNFQDREEVRKEIVRGGFITPRVVGLEDLTINVDSLF